MKIGIHTNQFDGRGSIRALFDYGCALQDVLNYNPVFITSNRSDSIALKKIETRFKLIIYDKRPIHEQQYNEQIETKNLLSSIVDSNQLDFLYMLKSGYNDNVIPVGCRVGTHCVFTMDSPHSDVYAGVSKFIANKYNQPLYVPHIINKINPSENLRTKLNIPNTAMIIGRHGGADSFNVEFAKIAIRTVLEHRTDIYFLFLSTDKFIDHERVIFLPWSDSDQFKFDFIYSIDAFLHSRLGGKHLVWQLVKHQFATSP